jgi:hypothetical protein
VPLQLSPDGTVSAAAGGNLATTTATSNPILNALTGGAYKNRPTAATAAYTQIPLALCKYYLGEEGRRLLVLLTTCQSLQPGCASEVTLSITNACVRVTQLSRTTSRTHKA